MFQSFIFLYLSINNFLVYILFSLYFYLFIYILYLIFLSIYLYLNSYLSIFLSISYILSFHLFTYILYLIFLSIYLYLISYFSINLSISYILSFHQVMNLKLNVKKLKVGEGMYIFSRNNYKMGQSSSPQEVSLRHHVWFFTSRCEITGFPKKKLFLEGSISKCPPSKDFFRGAREPCVRPDLTASCQEPVSFLKTPSGCPTEEICLLTRSNTNTISGSRSNE